MDNENKTCQKCGKTMKIDQFYRNRAGQYMDLCKKCLTMHIDNFNPETYIWILKEMDFPYIPSEWNTIRDKAFAKNPNLNGTSVFGKYMSKMRIKQFSDKTWADGERIQAEQAARDAEMAEEREKFEASLREQLDSGEISEAQYKTLVSTPTQNEEVAYATLAGYDNPFMPKQQGFYIDDPLDDIGDELTEEDKTYLAMKWGKSYKPSEWVVLEKKYEEMTRSFDIQDADTINTLIFICKTDLQMNQAIDERDIESFQKLSKVYESLRKSAKFTAVQNKTEKDEFVDCIGNLVAYCERTGGKIPKYESEIALDIIDEVINDLKLYTKDLIYEDTALAKQIEDYLKKREIIEQQKQDMLEAREKGLDYVELEDEDYQEYYRSIEEQLELDELTLQEEMGEL